VILPGSRFQAIPWLLKRAKEGKKIVYFAFSLSLLYNLIGLSYAITGQLTPLISAILMPLSSISIVLITTALSYWSCHRNQIKTPLEPTYENNYTPAYG
jgi:P-type Cu+ transporter